MKKYLTRKKAGKSKDSEEKKSDSRRENKFDRLGFIPKLDGRKASYKAVQRAESSVREQRCYYMPDIYLSDQGEVIADFQLIPNNSKK